jgi:mono/diheme cytochrome c family protein
MKPRLSLALLLLSMQAAYAVADAGDGKNLYAEFRCIECHGADARNAPAKDAVPLAGMGAEDIYTKARRFIETRAHDNAVAGCGSPPSAAQIRQIAAYLAGLPK